QTSVFILPDRPKITDVDPDSPANDNNPRIKGEAASGTTVRIYTDAGCGGPSVATGTATAFASPGLQVTVPDNSSTTFWAAATNANGSSRCSSNSITYLERTPPPAPVLTATDPVSPADHNFPHILGTAMAGTH